MFYTVTPNPTLDKTLGVSALMPGAIHRAETLRVDFGGKGINVSRALRALDISSICLGFVAGHNGRILSEGLQARDYACKFIEIAGETRQNITLFDRSKNEYTKLNEAGPVITEREFDAFTALIAQTARAGDLWAFCGSLPPGAPANAYARWLKLAQRAGARAFLDTSGVPLQEGFGARPFALKVNVEEASELLKRELSSDAQIVEAVRELNHAGIAVVVITRGAQGIVLGMENTCMLAALPPIETRSAVGAGDAAMAGLLWAVQDNCEAQETARRITACGAAAAMQEGSGVGDRALVESLRTRVLLAVAS